MRPWRLCVSFLDGVMASPLDWIDEKETPRLKHESLLCTLITGAKDRRELPSPWAAGN